MSYAIVILALFAIIIVHELGHLLVARRCGIRATAFSLGFGPVLLKRTWKGVEWRLSALPLGGYVKIPAVAPPSPREDAARIVALMESDEKQRLEEDEQQRHESGATELAPQRDPLVIDPLLLRLQDTLSDTQADSDELHAWLSDPANLELLPNHASELESMLNEHAPDTYHRATYRKRTAVILAGSAVNIVTGIVILFFALWLYSPLYATTWKVDSGTARKAGLPELAGQHVSQLADRDLTRSDGSGKTINIPKTTKDTISLRLADGSVQTVKRGSLTLRMTDQHRLGSAEVSASRAARTSLSITSGILTGTLEVASKALFDSETRKKTGTVVGAVGFAPAAMDIMPQYIGLISIALGLVNLLPILPLDGGHFLLTTLRALKRPISRRGYYAYGAVGMAFVLSLFVIGLINDVKLLS